MQLYELYEQVMVLRCVQGTEMRTLDHAAIAPARSAKGEGLARSVRCFQHVDTASAEAKTLLRCRRHSARRCPWRWTLRATLPMCGTTA